MAADAFGDYRLVSVVALSAGGWSSQRGGTIVVIRSPSSNRCSANFNFLQKELKSYLAQD